MKKLVLALGISIFAMLFLIGCQNSESPKINPTFYATVLEVHDDFVLVEPFEDEDELKSADKILVNTDVASTVETPKLDVGTEVCIVYNGDIQETYPAQISTAFAIYLLDENGEIITDNN